MIFLEQYAFQFLEIHILTTNILFPLSAQSGSKIIVLSPSNEFVLLEDRLWLNRTSETFFLQENSSKQARLHRNSNFHVDVIIDKANLVPTYSDYDAGNSNGENLEFSGVPGFSEVFYNYCS